MSCRVAYGKCGFLSQGHHTSKQCCVTRVPWLCVFVSGLLFRGVQGLTWTLFFIAFVLCLNVCAVIYIFLSHTLYLHVHVYCVSLWVFTRLVIGNRFPLLPCPWHLPSCLILAIYCYTVDAVDFESYHPGIFYLGNGVYSKTFSHSGFQCWLSFKSCRKLSNSYI